MTDWFRSWHGAPTDPKWLLIGRKAGVAPGMVSAVFYALMDYASQHEERGTVEGFDTETYAAFTGWGQSDIESVIVALSDKGLICNGKLAAWEKRQPKREDNSTARVTRHRETKRNEVKRTVTHGNAPEKSREDKIDATHLTRAGARAAQLDNLEEELREASGQQANPSPSLLDLSPIVALIDKGYSLHNDILPRLRAAAGQGKRPSTWAYYVPMITEGKSRTDAITPKAQAPPPHVWVPSDSPLWPHVSERWQHTKGKPLKPYASKHEIGNGAYIPSTWLTDAKAEAS